MTARIVFFLSDHTGITIETLGQSLLSQFEGVAFESIVLPFLNSPDKITAAIARIDEIYSRTGVKPVIFSSLTDVRLRSMLEGSQGILFDVFATFIGPLEQMFEQTASHREGKTHGVVDAPRYDARIEAIHFTLDSDDGVNPHNYARADLILIGVSRSGKTPTCLYLALQFGLFAANYPLTEDDLNVLHLPAPVRAHHNKLFGLTIQPDRLHRIRDARRSGSRYASLKQCRKEVSAAEELYLSAGIPFLNTGTISIEEIATMIIERKGLKRAAIPSHREDG